MLMSTDKKADHAAYMREYYASSPERRQKHIDSALRYKRQRAAERAPEMIEDRKRTLAAMVRTMTPTEAAYLAGLIDSDGGIYATLKHDKRNGLTHPAVSIYVTNTNRKMLDWCKEKTGIGSIREMTPHDSHRGERIVYRWDMGNRCALFVAAQILPYLVTKSEQAKLLIEMQELKLASRSHQRENPERQEDIVREIGALNRANGKTGDRVLKSEAA